MGRSPSIFAALLVCAPLVACASRPETGFLSLAAVSAPGATEHTLLVATTRERDPRPGTFFNGERASSLSYAEITMSVPPKHVPGQVEMPTSPPGNPGADFVVRDAAYLDGDKAFVHALNAQLLKRPKGSRRMFVFVHGYNTLFAEAVYRATQLAHDSKFTGVRCCLPGRRAEGSGTMSTTPIPPRRRATASNGRGACSTPMTARPIRA
jgi:esterase/lipase superfamily enzyme